MLANAQAGPPFRADHVGSLLRPPLLRQAFRDHLAKHIDDAHFAQIQDQCIRDVVRLQEEVGLAVVTDGEFRRGSYWGRFVERIEGFVIKPALFEFRDDHGHKVEFTAPYAEEKLNRTKPLALDEFVFLRDIAKATPKITLPSPSTMHFYRCSDFARKGVYRDVGAFFADLLTIYRIAKAICGTGLIRMRSLFETSCPRNERVHARLRRAMRRHDVDSARVALCKCAVKLNLYGFATSSGMIAP